MTTAMLFKGLRTILLLASLVGLAGTASAFPTAMTTGRETSPPIGHYKFCKQYPSQCQATGRDRGPARLTDATWKSIVQINYKVNNAIVPMTDEEIYGVEERWAFPTNVGDCEDYVLLKRDMLINAGFSPSDVLITVVLRPNGEGHAILTVRTDRGDFVLDNMRNKIMLWSETEYKYLKRQSSEDSRRWVSIQNGETAAVGSLQ